MSECNHLYKNVDCYFDHNNDRIYDTFQCIKCGSEKEREL